MRNLDSNLLIDLVDNTQHPQRSLPMPSVASCHVLVVVVVVVPLPFLSPVFTQTWCPFSLPSHPVFLFLSRSFSPSAVFFFFFLVLVFFLLSSPDALFPSPFFRVRVSFLRLTSFTSFLALVPPLSHFIHPILLDGRLETTGARSLTSVDLGDNILLRSGQD